MKFVTTKFKLGGLHEKHGVQLGILDNISAFDFKHKETKENLCRNGR